MVIVTAYQGTNAPLFRDILRLYCPQNGRVLDMTYGRGSFWADSDTLPLAITPRVVTMDNEKLADLRADLRKLPFRAMSFDVVVLDPPYANQGGAHAAGSIGAGIEASYNLKPATGTKMVLDLYERGLLEGKRVLWPGGVAIVKLQNAIESGRQVWIRCMVQRMAAGIGFDCVDEFVLVQNKTPMMRHSYQHHARKNHSFFVVFRNIARSP